MTPLLAIESLSHRLGGHLVLGGVDLALAPGEALALLGPSGCGKSTLLRLVAGLEAPAAGEIRLDGEPVSEPGRILVPPHRRGIGMVFQDLALWPGLSARDNVGAGVPREIRGRRPRRAEAVAALERCGLAGLEKRLPAQLSAGQQQRVALARALVSRPRLLLLDEPFTGLDLTVKERLLREIADLAEENELALVLVSHDPGEVFALCRRAVVIEEGVVVEEADLGRMPKPGTEPASETLRAMRGNRNRLSSPSLKR